MKVAVEPLKPSELPKMVDITSCQCYPLLSTKVEDSGEHVSQVLGNPFRCCFA